MVSRCCLRLAKSVAPGGAAVLLAELLAKLLCGDWRRALAVGSNCAGAAAVLASRGDRGARRALLTAAVASAAVVLLREAVAASAQDDNAGGLPAFKNAAAFLAHVADGGGLVPPAAALVAEQLVAAQLAFTPTLVAVPVLTCAGALVSSELVCDAATAGPVVAALVALVALGDGDGGGEHSCQAVAGLADAVQAPAGAAALAEDRPGIQALCRLCAKPTCATGTMTAVCRVLGALAASSPASLGETNALRLLCSCCRHSDRHVAGAAAEALAAACTCPSLRESLAAAGATAALEFCCSRAEDDLTLGFASAGLASLQHAKISRAGQNT